MILGDKYFRDINAMGCGGKRNKVINIIQDAGFLTYKRIIYLLLDISVSRSFINLFKFSIFFGIIF